MSDARIALMTRGDPMLCFGFFFFPSQLLSLDKNLFAAQLTSLMKNSHVPQQIRLLTRSSVKRSGQADCVGSLGAAYASTIRHMYLTSYSLHVVLP